MRRALKGQLAVLAMLLAMAGAAGCIRLISAEQLDDGSAVFCAKVEPTPTADAGPGAAPTIGPAMRYVPAPPSVGTVVTPAASAP